MIQLRGGHRNNKTERKSAWISDLFILKYFQVQIIYYNEKRMKGVKVTTTTSNC